MMQRMTVIASLIILVGGIILANVFGFWNPESDKIPIINVDGEYDPGDIRGSYALEDIEKHFEVPVEDLAEAFGLVGDIEAFQLKSLEEYYEGLGDYYDNPDMEIGTESVRYFVSLYTGIESNLIEATWLPLPAADILVSQGIALESFDDWLVDLEGFQPQAAEIEHVEPIVKGNTSIQNLYDLGFEKDQLSEVLMTDDFSREMLVKNICMSQGIEFSSVKAILQTYYDTKLSK